MSVNQGLQQFLRQWYETPPGRLLYQQEKRLLEKGIRQLFGYYLVQLGCPAELDWLQASRVSQKLVLDEVLAGQVYNRQKAVENNPDSQQDTQNHSVHFALADLDYLPLAKESIDVMLLPHTLESVSDPYYLLRQVDSALVPEGHVVLTGFNPYACGIVKNRLGKQGKSLRQANLVHSRRVIEWLEVLGYEVEEVNFSTISCYADSADDHSFLGWRLLERMETVLNRVGLQFGNVYCIVARKRVDSPRLVGLSWKSQRWFNWGKAGPLAANRQHRKTGYHR
ncbi:methyltransferase domain-containing protein [Thiomicrorhabdus sp. zzn3]|uniref:class I SAM-dependent methyltransferase n=1 Tax=Thiomicrorhabdus sp. zzn3 TaxID=3039775 RepID=UPI002436D8BE|nr:methyltransferase domain-containing protein [Thiomicrorhabdus sp. zzn3]MDG6778172.1 methyltransferase domain-containing protein [Thiomicrorhabdus sp. zzn3]